jgi:hypothetical protein
MLPGDPLPFLQDGRLGLVPRLLFREDLPGGAAEPHEMAQNELRSEPAVLLR